MKLKATAGLAALAAVAAALAPVASASAAADPHAGGSVHVQGRWTITVRGRNGHVVSTRRFENSLTGQGQKKLIQTLSGQIAVGGWQILWRHPASVGNGFQIENVPSIKLAYILPTNDNQEAAPGSANITLSGQDKPAAPTTIQRVGTNIDFCGGTTAPANCVQHKVNEFGFTEKTLDTPLPVAAGQTIDFTVQISFS
jgi:hypothetical protein